MSEHDIDAPRVIRMRSNGPGMHNSEQVSLRDLPPEQQVVPGMPVVEYSGPSDHWRVTIPAEELAGLIGPFDGKKRAYLTALLNGCSKTMAAARVGYSSRMVRKWQQDDPAFAQASATLYDIGFASVLESELYRRAMAGEEDRGSMRALELIVKSRDPEYRDKSSVELSMVRAAQDHTRDLVADYKPTTERHDGPS